MKDKKAAKKLIKRAKKHPEWYSEKDVWYANILIRSTHKGRK